MLVTNMAVMARRKRTARLRAAVALLGASVISTTASATPPPAPPGTSVVPPSISRPWGGCRLDSNTMSQLATETGRPVDFVVAYSSFSSAGQPLGTTSPQRYTGVVLCGGPSTWVTSYTERTPIPNTDTGGDSIDILNTEQSQWVRYTLGSGGFHQFCQELGTDKTCHTVTAGSGASDCRLSTTTFNAIKTAIQAGPNIRDSKVNFVFVVAYNVSDETQGTVCAAPSYAVTGKATDAVLPTINVRDTEDLFIMRYELNGGSRNGAVEKRYCTTADRRADCFRVYIQNAL
jgi:hypothetical protein